MTLVTLPFLGILLWISLIDLRHYLIPDSLILALSGVGILRMLLEQTYASSLAGAVLLFALFLILHLLFPRGMGFGDVKLAGSIGLFLGIRLGLLAIFLSFIFGASVGTVLILTRRKTLKDPLPFGPFLALGAALSLFFGEHILAWYFRTFL